MRLRVPGGVLDASKYTAGRGLGLVVDGAYEVHSRDETVDVGRVDRGVIELCTPRGNQYLRRAPETLSRLTSAKAEPNFGGRSSNPAVFFLFGEGVCLPYDDACARVCVLICRPRERPQAPSPCSGCGTTR